MSVRPNAAGASPWSGRRRRVSDSNASALIFCRTLEAPAPRWRGSCSAAHRLAARRSHAWAIPANDSRPGWPNTARSQVSLACSAPGSARPRATARASARSSAREGLPGTRSAGHCAIEATWSRRSVSQTARKFTSVSLAPPRMRCPAPNSTSTTTSGASPRRPTCPPSETADWVSSQRRWSIRGSAVTALRHRT